MRLRGPAVALSLALGLGLLLLATVDGRAAPPAITGVDVVSPHEVPVERVRAAIGPLAGTPRWRGAVRESLARVFGLGLFSVARVDEIAEPGGVRLRYYLERAPHVTDVAVRGDLGLDVVQVLAAAGLAVGASAEPEALGRARDAVAALYAREGYLGARVEVESRAEPRTNGRRITFVVDAGTRTRVGRVTVAGAERLEEELVRRTFGLQEGAAYGDAAVRRGVEAVERLAHGKGFLTARARVEQGLRDTARNRIPLTLHVAEGPHVAVEFPGAATLPHALLRERLTFTDSGVVDEVEMRASERQLTAAYRNAGFPFATVHGTLGGEPRNRIARFQVTEGSRVVVSSVRFTGSPVPAASLLERMETRPSGLLRRRFFSEDALARDVRVLTTFLESQGFPEARVGAPEVAFTHGATEAEIHVPIDTGPKVEVGSVDVEGASALTRGELLSAVLLKPGSPWSRTAADEGRRAIEQRYARHGYHAAEVAVDSTRRDGVADVTYRVREGEPTRIGRVLVRGLAETREEVVRREVDLTAGAPFTRDALEEVERRLAELGLFERVDLEPVPPPPAPVADVLVTVRERRPWHVDIGAGYSSFEGARGFVEVGRDNLFGTGRSIAVRERASERGDRTELLYAEPSVLGTRWRGDGSLFRERRDEIGYSFERYGLSLGVHRDLFTRWIRGLKTATRYEISRVDRYDVDLTLVEGDVVPGTEIVATLTPHLILDRRDRPLDPTRGSLHLAAFQVGGLGLGGDSDFAKLRLETSWFLDWLPPTVLALSGRLGLAWPLGDTTVIPPELRFYAGGSNTVRGYRENRLGPLDAKGNPTGGNATVLLNAELRFPIWRWFSGAVFFDSGMVTEEVVDLDDSTLRSGAGAGLRLTTPVGPVRLDVGYPLDPAPGQRRDFRVYVTVGHAF